MSLTITERAINRLKRVLGDKYRIRRSYDMFGTDIYILHPKSWWFFKRWLIKPIIVDLDLEEIGGIWIEAKTVFLKEAKEIAPLIQKEFKVPHMFVDEI